MTMTMMRTILCTILMMMIYNLFLPIINVERLFHQRSQQHFAIFLATYQSLFDVATYKETPVRK